MLHLAGVEIPIKATDQFSATFNLLEKKMNAIMNLDRQMRSNKGMRGTLDFNFPKNIASLPKIPKIDMVAPKIPDMELPKLKTPKIPKIDMETPIPVKVATVAPPKMRATPRMPTNTAGFMMESGLPRSSVNPLFGIPMVGYLRAEQLKQEQEKKTGNLLMQNRNKMLAFGLSLMFTGQALQHSMQSIMKPAEDAVGIFEIIGDIFLILMLPAMLAVLPLFIQLLNWVVAMPDSVKLLIGALVILAFLLGTVAAVVGQIVAFWAGITGMAATIDAITTAIGTGTVGAAGGVGLLGALAGFLTFILAAAALIEGQDFFKKNQKTIEANAPFLNAQVTGTQQVLGGIPVVEPAAVWTAEAYSGLEYQIGDYLFGQHGIFHDAIVNALANPQGAIMKADLGLAQIANPGGTAVNILIQNTAGQGGHINTQAQVEGTAASRAAISGT